MRDLSMSPFHAAAPDTYSDQNGTAPTLKRGMVSKPMLTPTPAANRPASNQPIGRILGRRADDKTLRGWRATTN